MTKVNPNMIVLARESRGKTQLELANDIDIPQSNLSRIERGEILNFKHETLEKIASVLKYPNNFFYQEYKIYPPNIHYRKRLSIDQRTLLKADALMNIYRFNVQQMLNSIDLSVQNIPIITDQYGTPEKVASFLRSYWKVPKGAINDLSALVESNGIIVIQIDFETDKIEGRSVITDTGHPIIFINKNSSGDRQRLTLGHELGHIIMHLKTIPTFARDEEEEAFRFASEFLMPFDEVKYNLTGKITIEKLADLKRVWKIAMQAILMRIQKEEMIDYNQSRYLWSKFNSLGIRKKEPIEIPHENPTLINKMVQMLMNGLNYSKEDLSSVFNINVDEIENRYLKSQGVKLRIA